MAANDYTALPSAAAGLSLASAASGWGYSSYGTIVSSGSNTTGLMISGAVIQPDVSSAGISLDTTYEGVLELYSGASDTLIAQIPFTWRVDSQAEHTIQSYTIRLVEPVQVASGLQVRARVADSNTSALTHNGIKVQARIPSESITQDSFRFYEDGTETGATAIDSKDTNITRTVNSDSNLQLRIRTQNSGDSLLSTDDYQLQYELNDSGTYANVGAGVTLNNSGSFAGNGTSTVNTSFTVNSGTNRLLVVMLAMGNTVTSLTYNGVSLTNATGAGNRDIWYLVSPATGSNTLSLTVSGSSPASTSNTIAAFNGVLQTSPLDIGTTNSAASGTGVSKSITIAENGSLVVDSGWASGNGGPLGSLTANNSQISLDYGASSDDQAKGGYLLTESAGTRTYGYTAGADSTWAYRVVVFKPVISVLGYNSASLTDGNATTNRLGQGGVTLLSDDFNDNSIDSAKWTNWGGANVTETSNQIQIVSGTGSGSAYGMDTANIYDFRDTYAHIQVVDDGTARVNGQVIPLQITQSSGNAVYWYIENGTAYCMKAVASVYTQVGSTRTHTDGDYYRVRESGGTTYWDYSTDAITWTNQTSQSNPIDLSGIYISILTYNAAVVTSATAKLDNFQMAKGTFIAGEISEDGLVDDYTHTANDYTEHLYSLTVVSSAVSNNDTLDFRVLKNGSALTTYNVTPRITVSKSSSVSVTPGVASLTTTSYAPIIGHTINMASPTALTLSTFAPSIVLGTVVTPSVASLSLSTFAPTVTVSDNKTVTPGVASLTTSTFAPTVFASDNKTVTPDVASLTTSTFAPSVVVNNIVTPGVASLTTSSFAPTVTASDNKTVTPDTASLSISTFQPTVTASDNKTVTPDVASLSITTYAPTVSASSSTEVIPGTASLTTSTFSPTVSATANVTVTPGTLSLTTSSFAPTVTATANVTVTPGTASLTITTQTISVTTGDNREVVPGTASFSITTYAPTVTVSDNKTVTPSVASLSLNTFAPTVATSDNKYITPGTSSLTITTQDPIVFASDNKRVTPEVASLIATMFAPTVSVGNNITVTPGTATLRLSGKRPIINGEVPTRSYYIDTNGEIYWVLNQEIGLVEKV